MSRYARKIDANQPKLVEGLRKCGVKVRVTSQLGDGFPDLLCGWQRRFVALEVKDPSQPPSKRQLTEAEAKFFEEWTGYPVFVVETLDEALAAVGVKEGK